MLTEDTTASYATRRTDHRSLALAALNVPGIVAGASASAGLAVVATAVVFAFPLAIWLRYARDVSGSGGLYSFVEAAAARPLALVQAYLLYTTTQIVYDTLPAVCTASTGISPSCRSPSRWRLPE
jgi:hypothetical protein